MSIVSFNFIIFIIITSLIYYIVPKSKRWIALLVFSFIFFYLNCAIELIFYLITGIIVAFIGTNIMYKNKSDKKRKLVLFLSLLVIIGILFVLKYYNIIPMTFNRFAGLFSINTHLGMISLLAPLGISYYTLSIIGYVVDVYRGAYKPLNNPFKLLLFTSYYPIMISGPVLRFKEMEEELFIGKDLDYSNIYIGFERIIYGIMKKIVIANHLSFIVTTIFNDYNYFTGVYIIYGVILYAIQIYCDFSGCMDIVIGASKMYGVKLPENFDSPFFSRNLSEFWRRWHISLGTWAKDYIMYPLLKSNLFQKLGSSCKKKFGKKYGKKIPTILAILVLWLLIGLWHGASYKYIFAAGILPWIYLSVSQLFEDKFSKITSVFKFRTECFSYHLFQSIRTFLLMCFIWLVVCAPNLDVFDDVLRNIFIYNYDCFEKLPRVPFNIILMMLLLVTVVDYFNYKKINVFEVLQEQNIWFRYLVLIFIISIILIFGAYGPGYNAVDFIYGGF